MNHIPWVSKRPYRYTRIQESPRLRIQKWGSLEKLILWNENIARIIVHNKVWNRKKMAKNLLLLIIARRRLILPKTTSLIKISLQSLGTAKRVRCRVVKTNRIINHLRIWKNSMSIYRANAHLRLRGKLSHLLTRSKMILKIQLRKRWAKIRWKTVLIRII